MIGEWVKEKEETRETKNREKRETDDFTESENTYIYIYIVKDAILCYIHHVASLMIEFRMGFIDKL